jgi:hypothetical protein
VVTKLKRINKKNFPEKVISVDFTYSKDTNIAMGI